MSMLARYQKAGGFLQLLKLIETCGKQKQENFLKIIEQEDPRWAEAIKSKMITVEKVFSWDAETLAEIAGRLPHITIATALHGISAGEWEKFSQTFSHSQKRAIDDLKNSKNPTAAEISAAYVKIIEEVRTMIKDGYLRVEKFAPELHIEDDVEEAIGKSLPVAAVRSSSAAGPAVDEPTPLRPHAAPTPTEASTPTVAPTHSAPSGSFDAHAQAELSQLRVKVQSLHHENTQLKNEVKILKERITQIKKLAA
jgi:hypothetical protein